jgi:isochorismate synthase
LAKETINEIETFNRGLYSGRVGWCDNQGNGEWAVTIRCAEINGNRATLFSGAGIVEESCPESELKETNTKLKTMLRVLGVRDVNAIQEPTI